MGPSTHLRPGFEVNPDQVFETKDVLQITGMSSVFLNKLLERESFGLQPSVRTGGGRGSRRVFNRSDLYDISLVWWLFQSGLRSKVIERVLRDLAPASGGSASDAVRLLLTRHIQEESAQVLVIHRNLAFTRSKAKHSTSRAYAISESELPDSSEFSSMQIIPLGRLLLELNARIETFQPGKKAKDGSL